ncbi:MAG: D-arabinono-1,4-lactone oxidase, partial [Saprospiraceae bacterium]|nr:D-arabinono-1,4-lactone oxidase [Saprospiraceae bacterium]
GHKSIRLNFMRFATDAGSPIDFYYQYYQLFKAHKIPFRLHLGKYLPGKEIPMWASHIRASYPMFNEFDKLRQSMDPNNLFLTKYWSEYLLLT